MNLHFGQVSAGTARLCFCREDSSTCDRRSWGLAGHLLSLFVDLSARSLQHGVLRAGGFLQGGLGLRGPERSSKAPLTWPATLCYLQTSTKASSDVSRGGRTPRSRRQGCQRICGRLHSLGFSPPLGVFSTTFEIRVRAYGSGAPPGARGCGPGREQ